MLVVLVYYALARKTLKSVKPYCTAFPPLTFCHNVLLSIHQSEIIHPYAVRNYHKAIKSLRKIGQK